MTVSTDESTFLRLLREQIGHEFDAHQQYVAIAVWFDGRDLAVEIPAGAPVRNDFTQVTDPIGLALKQEKQVTSQIEAIFAAARAEGDALGEQFLLWFLKEQVEEVASPPTLLTVATRAGDNLFDLENYVAREQIDDAGESADAPAAAGGAL